MNTSEDIIKKYNLSEAVKRLQKINEYTFYDSTMVEADDDPNDSAQQQGGMPPMGGPQGGAPDMSGMGNMGGGDPNGGMPPMGGDNSQMGGDPNAMGGGDPNGGMPPMGDDQGDDSDFGDMGDDGGLGGDDSDFDDIDMDTEQPGDEVIDVDELTQSQETTEFKVDNVDDKLTKVLKMISKFSDAIKANDEKIEDLKNEFEKRNPTAEETLNLRSMAAYPFSERPEDYWKKQQETHPNYRIISDNDVPTSEEQKEFEIRKSDIDNMNERDVLRSLGESVKPIKLSDFFK